MKSYTRSLTRIAYDKHTTYQGLPHRKQAPLLASIVKHTELVVSAGGRGRERRRRKRRRRGRRGRREREHTAGVWRGLSRDMITVTQPVAVANIYNAVQRGGGKAYACSVLRSYHSLHVRLITTVVTDWRV